MKAIASTDEIRRLDAGGWSEADLAGRADFTVLRDHPIYPCDAEARDRSITIT